LAAIRAVSAIAKKAEQRIRRTRARTSAQRGTVSKVYREESGRRSILKPRGRACKFDTASPRKLMVDMTASAQILRLMLMLPPFLDYGAV
jgi:hypothetical protein